MLTSRAFTGKMPVLPKPNPMSDQVRVISYPIDGLIIESKNSFGKNYLGGHDITTCRAHCYILTIASLLV
jgi:hypothetical protein